MEMEKGGANLSPAASAPASRTMLLCPKYNGAGWVSFGNLVIYRFGNLSLIDCVYPR